jgi:hypothetical protein
MVSEEESKKAEMAKKQPETECETTICGMKATEEREEVIDDEKENVDNEQVKKANGTNKSSLTPKAKSSRKFTFEERLEECKKFKKEHGHCKILTTGRNTNKAMGVWVQEMRRNFKLQMTTGKPRRCISNEQIIELDAIGFHWGFKPKAGMPQSDEMWEKCFEEAKSYHEEHGNFDVPPDDEDYSSPPFYLAEWVCVQRDQKKRRDSKMKCNMNIARVKKLSAIGFNWTGPRKLQDKSSK